MAKDSKTARKKRVKQTVCYIQKELERLQIPATYFANSYKTGSTYLRFVDTRLRSIRIADHEGRQKYRYKWNIREDISRSFSVMDRGVKRHYYRFTISTLFLCMFVMR